MLRGLFLENIGNCIAPIYIVSLTICFPISLVLKTMKFIKTAERDYKIVNNIQLIRNRYRLSIS